MVAEPATKHELDDLRGVVVRSLKDTKALNLSADGKFGFAYNAPPVPWRPSSCAPPAIASRAMAALTTTPSSPWKTADAAFAPLAAYFDACRVKRNEFSYDQADVVSDTEANELASKATQFALDVDAWLQANHPSLA